MSNLLSGSMMVDALVAWLSTTLNGSWLHMPMGTTAGGPGRSYIPILSGAANCADAEVMNSGGEAAALAMLNETHTRKNQPS